VDAVDGAGSLSQQRCSEARRTGGFTLLEILVAATITSIILLTIYGSFHTVLKSVERVDKDQARLRIADFLTTHFEENLSGAYLPNADRFGQNVVFIGENREAADGRPIDTLTFFTNASRMGGGALPGDTKQVAYGLVEEEDECYTLTVFEKPRLLMPLTEDEASELTPGGASWTVPMASLDFAYFDGADWMDSWNSASEGRLPLAVKIEARFVEKRFEVFAERLGIQEPVLVMIVSIPLGISTETLGE
jgi:prepilin-type N-terminal cleavage/methylation domain-containing protein